MVQLGAVMFSWLRNLFRPDTRVRVRRLLQDEDRPTGIYLCDDGPLVELTCWKHCFADTTAPLLKIFDPKSPERTLTVPGVFPAHPQSHRELVHLFCLPELIQPGMVVEVVGNAWDAYRDQMNEYGRWPIQKPLPFQTVRRYDTPPGV